MPDLHTSPEHTIAEWDTTVTGGMTLVLHTPAEVESLKVLCRLPGQPPANRWRAIVNGLKATSLWNLDDWHQYRDRISSQERSSPRSETPSVPDQAPEEEENAIEMLIGLLDYVRTLWEHENQLPGLDSLALAVTLADPDFPAYPRITVNARRPAVAFHLGSPLQDTILTGIKTATHFVVAFFTRRSPDMRIEAALRETRASRIR